MFWDMRSTAVSLRFGCASFLAIPSRLRRNFFDHVLWRRYDRRRALSGSHAAYRLIFGEGDLLPGIIVDRYGDYLVLQTLSSGADALKPLLVEILQEAVRPKGILQRNDAKVRRLEGLEEIRSVLWGTRSR